MNRNSNLAQALPTWLKAPEIDEIIVLDWSSREPVKNIVDRYKDERITLARVENQERWIAARAFNLAARLTTRTKMVKMDADTKISPDFFRVHQLKPGTFMTGNWRKARNENQKHLYGITYVYRADFFKINGFNEYLEVYGWADSDLFERLEGVGLKQVDFNIEKLSHIQHEGRVKNQKSLLGKNTIKDDVAAIFGIQRNRFLCKNLPAWDTSCELLNFEVKVTEYGNLVCHQVGDAKYQIPEELKEEAENHALRMILHNSIEGFGASMPLWLSKTFSKIILVKLNQLFNFVDKVKLDSAPSFNLITVLHSESNIDRTLEYLICIHNNYYHPNIGEIHVFYDTSKDEKYSVCLNYLKKKKGIILNQVSGQPSYKQLWEYANTFASNNRVIIANPDVYFNETLGLLQDVVLTNTCLTLTGWKVKTNGDLELPLNQNKLPNYLSTDAWIFTVPFEINFDRKLSFETSYGLSLLKHQLYKKKAKIYNPCLDIQICKLNNAIESYEKDSKNLNNLDSKSKFTPEEAKSLSCAVPWCHFSDIGKYPVNELTLNRNNIILQIYINTVDEDKLLLILSLMILSEKTERNLWIVNLGLSEEIVNFIKFTNSGRFNLISSYRNQEEVILYDSVIHPQFAINFDVKPDIYIKASFLFYHSLLTYDELQQRLATYKKWVTLEVSGSDKRNNLNLDEYVKLVEKRLKYKYLIKSAWDWYLAANYAAMREDLQKSLAYKYLSTAETISDWINHFSNFSLAEARYLDAYSLSNLPEWQKLISFALWGDRYCQTSTEKKTKVSIITSVFKGDKYIEEFLKDITRQTVFDRCELILINPNSPGNEEPVIEHYLKQYPNIVYQKLDYDPGLYEVWNIAIKMARGEYITNANLDDRRAPEHIEKHLKVLEENLDFDLVCASLKVTRTENETWENNTAHATWFGPGFPEYIKTKHLFRKEKVNGTTTGKIVSQCIPHCMPVWRKSLHDEYGYFDETEYGTGADWEFWLRCSSAGAKFKLIREPLGIYLENASSYMRVFSQREQMMNKVIEKYYRTDLQVI
ncbi:MAG: glycosyltransferase [Okeania sp. SIO3B3]|nr:glycosyltransferase [Okeania sp. SIO3B3]